MICKKCKTAVDENAKICNSCGAPVKNKNGFWKKTAFVLIFAATVGAYALNNINNSDNNSDIIPEDEIIEQIPENTAKPSHTPAASSENQDTVSAVREENTPTSNADFEKSIEEVWDIVDEAVICVNEYYEIYSETVTFISRNGYLYDEPAKAYVLVNDLKDLTGIDEKYLDESLMFFYIRPSDLQGFSSLRVSSSNDLKIFVGYETKDGFAIAAEFEQGGIITREDLKSVIDKYSWEHGAMRKVSFQSDEYEQIMSALSTSTGVKGFDVRYMYRDDKYICVVASPKNNPSRINQYILENNEGAYSVKVSNIESFSFYKKGVNNYLPDFNQQLLPNYDLGSSLKYLTESFDNIVEAMNNSGLISADDMPLEFSSGTTDFVYLEFASGKHFVGHMENNTWRLYPVESYETGRALMETLVKRAPTFILKQY